MGNVLSKDEVDSLLEEISEGRIETGTDILKTVVNATRYDFRSQTGPLHQSMSGLAIIHERFVDLLGNSFSAATRSKVDVTLTSLSTVNFADFLDDIHLPASVNVFKMEPLRGFSMLVLESPVVFTFVEAFFGGRGAAPVTPEGRGFTSIEMKVVHKVIHMVFDDLQKAWADYLTVAPTLVRSEMDPKFASIVTPEDAVVSVNLTVKLENRSGSLALCFPLSSMECVKDKLRRSFRGGNPERDQVWESRIEKMIGKIAVNVSCILGTATLSGGELLKLKKNDVIPLNEKVTDHISVCIEGVPKYKAYPGASNNNNAVKVDDKILKE